MNVVFHILGMIAGIALTAWRFRKAGMKLGARFFIGFIVVILIGVAGSRLLFVMSDVGYYAAHWREIFSLQETIIQGALVFGFLAIVVFARLLGIPFWRLFDLVAPGLALGQAIGRIGCLVYGCCYGLPVHLPWLPADVTVLYPTQLMHAGANFLIVFALLILERRGYVPFTGFVGLVYVLLYSAQRLLIDYLRATGAVFAAGMPFAGIRMARVVSVASILLAAGVLAWKWARARRIRGGDQDCAVT
jgi:phosphatidylglycerol:prolipoprotein diacylglycerol transferase